MPSVSSGEVVTLLAEFKADLSDLKNKFNEAKKLSKQSGEDIARGIKDASAKIGTGAAVVGAAISAPLIAASKSALDFGKNWSQVVTQLSKEDRTPKKLNELKSGVFELSQALGVDVVDATKAMFMALSSGVESANVLDFLRENAKASAGGFADLNDVVGVSTSALDAYKEQGLEVGHALDVMMAATKFGKMEFKDLATSLGPLLPIASQAGVKFEEVNAAVAALTRTGFSTSEAVTAMRSALVNVYKPSDDATKVADQLGIKFNVAELKARGLVPFMDMIRQKMQEKGAFHLVDLPALDNAKAALQKIQEKVQETQAELTKAPAAKRAGLEKRLADLKKSAVEAEAKLGKIAQGSAELIDKETGYAKLFGDVQGLAGMLALTANNGKLAHDSMDNINQAAGQVDDTFNTMKEHDPGFIFRQLKGYITEISVTFGQLVLEGLKPTLDSFVKWAKEFNTWAKEHPDKIAKMIELAKTIAEVALALSAVSFAINRISEIYLVFKTLSKIPWGALGGLIANPIVLAIVVIVGAFVSLYFTFQKYWGVIKILWRDACDAIGEFFSGLWESVSTGASDLITWIKSVWDGIPEFFSGICDSIAEFFVAAWDTIVDSFWESIETIKQGFSDLWEWIKSAPGNLWDAVSEGAQALNPFASSYSFGSVASSSNSRSASTAALGAALRSSVSTGSSTAGGITVVINPQPGMSEMQIGRAVARVLNTRRGRI